MIASLKDGDKYKYFPFEKMFDLASAVDTFYKNTSGKEMLLADIEEAKNLMPGILALIEYLKNTNTNYIIEGVHFLPSLIKDINNEESIKTIILTKNDSDKIYDGLKSNQGKGDWIADNIKDDEILSTTAKSLAEYGKYFETESIKYGCKYINTEDDFFDKIEEALNYLT